MGVVSTSTTDTGSSPVHPAGDAAGPPAGTGAGSVWLRRVLMVNLVAQSLIILTGGTVRVTGSGLGCPTWPQCVPGSYVPVLEQAEGFHKWIEFGNRLLTFVVALTAIAALLALRRWAPHRRQLRPWAWLVIAGVVAQAVVGGVTVLTGLHPVTVSFHFLASLVLVAASAVLVGREREGDGPPRPVVPPLVQRLGWVTAAVGAVVMVLGTVVTGSGPHSGDAEAPARYPFDPRTISWLHADAVMLFVGLAVGMVVLASVVHRPVARAAALTGPRPVTGHEPAPERTRTAWAVVLLVTAAQGVLGYVQYLTGLPEVLVVAHMAGATALTIALVFGVLALRERAPAAALTPASEAEGPGRRSGGAEEPSSTV